MVKRTSPGKCIIGIQWIIKQYILKIEEPSSESEEGKKV